MSWTVRPARFTERTTFWTEVTAPVTMCTSTSRRTPDIPMGSRTPSPSSTTKLCGRTWMISRSWGRLTARAASMTRSTSASLTSWCRRPGRRRGPASSRVSSRPLPLEDHLITEPEVDRSHVLRRDLREDPFEARQTLLPVLASEANFDAVDGIEDRALPAAHVDLRDLRGQPAPASEERADHRDRRAGLRPGGRAHGRELVGREAADDGHRRRHGGERGAEQPPLLVHPVEPPAVDERDRTPLLDADHDPVRQLAHDVGPAHRGKRVHAAGHARRVETEDVRPARNRGHRQDLLG